MSGAGGAFVAVVGPSGAGKDTLIAFAARAMAGDPRLVFARRVVTRPCDGQSEDHDTLTQAAFDTRREAGGFAVSWTAHGLSYGLPAEVDAVIRDGRIVVANVSRRVLATLSQRYPRLVIAEVTARPDILADRLASRGRESRQDTMARLARIVPRNETGDVTRIDNSGDLSQAGNRLVGLIESLRPSRG